MSINVKDYGAVGNGTTDDTGAVKSALDAVNTLFDGKGVLYFPPGTYLIGEICIPSYVTVMGASKAATVIQIKPVSAYAFRNSVSCDDVNPAAISLTFDRMTILGHEAADNAIVLQGCDQSDIRDVDAYNFKKPGAVAFLITGYYNETRYIQSNYNRIQRCYLYNVWNGIKACKLDTDPSTGGASFTRVSDIKVELFSDVGVDFANGEGCAGYDIRCISSIPGNIGVRGNDAQLTLTDVAGDGISFTVYVRLSGNAGMISKITVTESGMSPVELLSAPVTYATSLAATTAAVVSAINANTMMTHYKAVQSADPTTPGDIHIYSDEEPDVDSPLIQPTRTLIKQDTTTVAVDLSGGMAATFSGPTGTGGNISGANTYWGDPEGHPGSDTTGVYLTDACSANIIMPSGNGPKSRINYQSLTAYRKTNVWRPGMNRADDLYVRALRGATVTASQYLQALASGAGATSLNTGAATRTGRIEFANAAGTRQGYIGNATTGGPIQLSSDTGAGWIFLGGPVSFVIPSFTWSTKPSAANSSGMEVFISDLGINGSRWRSDGTNWNPIGTIVIGAGAASVSLTGSTVETALATVNVPAGAMSSNRKIEADTLWTVTGSTNSKQLRARFGTIATTPFLNAAITTATTITERLCGKVSNRTASSQVMAPANMLGAPGSSAAGVINTSVNTVASADLFITGQLALTSETITLEAYEVRLLP